MKHATAIGRALEAVRSSNPLEATRLIQAALRGSAGPEAHASQPPYSILQIPEILNSSRSIPNKPRRREGLGKTIAALRSFKLPFDVDTHRPELTLPESPNFTKRCFACASGQRDFRLYVPACIRPRGLIVMLHGCRQTAEDFALGTDMNALAEENDLLVAYPHQPSSANPMSCWNWFRPQDQARLGGEAGIIAGLTRALCSEFEISRENIFVAGLSAGGAMAAVLGSTYPDLYSAVGIHSGLPYKSAHDVNSAFAAMRGKNGNRSGASAEHAFQPRLIIFHGSADQTVAAANATLLWNDAVRSKGPGGVLELTVSAGGRTVDRRIFSAPAGVASVEQWIIHGSGHAWSGGNPRGSYTGGDGPNASAEMVRFFLAESPLFSSDASA
jgi:poly(hydroxyalkanoate) depolymerase family esterase